MCTSGGINYSHGGVRLPLLLPDVSITPLRSNSFPPCSRPLVLCLCAYSRFFTNTELHRICPFVFDLVHVAPTSPRFRHVVARIGPALLSLEEPRARVQQRGSLGRASVGGRGLFPRPSCPEQRCGEHGCMRIRVPLFRVFVLG